MRTKNKTLVIAGFEPPISSVLACKNVRNALDNHATALAKIQMQKI